MNNRLIEAFYDAPHTVLGKRLKPFTIRHAFALEVGGNQAYNGENPTIGDLFQAVEVCSMPSIESREKMVDPAWYASLIRWNWERRAKKLNLVEELIKFSAYIEDYNTAPEQWADDGISKESLSHWTMILATALMSRLGMSKEEAWETSPGEANWMLAAVFEIDPWLQTDFIGEEYYKAQKALEDAPDYPQGVQTEDDDEDEPIDD